MNAQGGASAAQPISVSCEPMGQAWTCRVKVGDDASATTHEVTFSGTSMMALGGASRPEELVEESFRFLLEREPRESILPRFDLSDISRFFPEYESEIIRRTGG